MVQHPLQDQADMQTILIQALNPAEMAEQLSLRVRAAPMAAPLQGLTALRGAVWLPVEVITE